MTLRCALYARYSSDQQRAASIEDQFRVCREHAEREGWKIAGCYKDSAISGDSVILRPGIQGLLEDARRGLFEIVVAEALDRVSRDQADVATLYKHLRFAGVMIVTLSEGEINELHVGLKGTMNALFLKDLAAKTRRGLRGRVEAGKSGGGICYGYDVVKLHDDAGERIRGEREIDETQAEIVRRIFREFAQGTSPRAIARRLNEDGIPGPKGKLWTDSVLRGHAKRGTGLLNNELYIGRLIWNRQRFLKNPDTGKRVARLNPPEEWIVAEVPELRIVDDELWQAAKVRQGEISEKYATSIAATRAAQANYLNSTHRPRYLLSGLLECGVCGGSYAKRGQDRYACSNYIMSGSCSNSRTIRRVEIEERVMAGLREKLMAPEAAAEAMQAYAEETNRLNRERRASGATDRKELADIEKKIATMLDVIEDGGYARGMMDRMRELEARQDEIAERLSAAPVDLPDIHPNIAIVYRRKVERLAEALADPRDRDEAADAIRGLIERIVLTPGEKRSSMNAALHGDLGTILEWAGNGSGKGVTDTPKSGMSVSVVAGAGFEPASLLRSGQPIRSCTCSPLKGVLRRSNGILSGRSREVDFFANATGLQTAPSDLGGRKHPTVLHCSPNADVS
ncbi:MAG: recombinase family protein [Rhodospirillaceae bacterium]|nr:recombinase family protein [Rhodospirillaceae bacterium]